MSNNYVFSHLNKLSHNVEYVFSIFYGDVMTSNLDNY